MNTEVQRFEDVQELNTAAAELICQLAALNVKTHGGFTLALSGGQTPRRLYETLARSPYLHALPWEATHLFWGDERYVPLDHPDSNAAAAAQALIQYVPLPLPQVHRVPTEAATAEAAAEAYESLLREHFAVFDPSSELLQCPVFDLILLGLGQDGHTASLFPDSPALTEQTRWVLATPVPPLEPRVRRITLTLPVINAAKNVLFLVAGAAKYPLVQAISEHPDEAERLYPAARVKPTGKLRWFVV